MSSDNAKTPPAAAPLDLSRWRLAPAALLIGGGVLALIGLVVNRRQFCYSWLETFMFFLSLCLGGFFMVLMHHLFDASWSIPIRRFCEHIACLAPMLALLFIPILLNVLLAGPETILYKWMAENPQTDHALHAKLPLFTKTAFVLIAIFCFAVWWVFSARLRYWSLQLYK